MTTEMGERRYKPSTLGFSYVLNQMIISRDLPNKDVAESIGVTPGAITLWTKGCRVPRRHKEITAIIHALKATPRESADLLWASGFAENPPSYLEALIKLRRFLSDETVPPDVRQRLEQRVARILNLVEAEDNFRKPPFLGVFGKMNEILTNRGSK